MDLSSICFLLQKVILYFGLCLCENTVPFSERPWPFNRPVRIPDLVEEKFKAIQASALKGFRDTFKKETAIVTALKALRDGGQQSSTPGSNRPTPNRTMASPDWGGEIPINFRQIFNIAGVTAGEFETNNTLLSRFSRFLFL